MFERVVQAEISRWENLQDDFLAAMWAFDENFRQGLADQGDNQNGKGDFFNDLLALVLENATGKTLVGRGRVPGLFFPDHYLDAAYPPKGTLELVVETKVAGAPRTGRNPRQKNPHGRPGSSDLKKRITEAGFKTIDLKAEAARLAGRGEGPGSDLVTWLRRTRPLCFLMLAVRVVSSKDLDKTIQFANTASRVMDEVGLIAYHASRGQDRYELAEVPPHLELDRVMSRVSTALRSA